MTSLSRRNQNRIDIWPGFVDALASLLMVIIFLLMIFVIAQFFLGEALTGSNKALNKLRVQTNELSELLSLERTTNIKLNEDIQLLSSRLSESIIDREKQQLLLKELTIRSDALAAKVTRLDADLFQRDNQVSSQNERITKQIQAIQLLKIETQKLIVLKSSLEQKIRASLTLLSNKNKTIEDEKKLSLKARAEIAYLNNQITVLRNQITKIAQMLDNSELKAKNQQVRITSLGKRLNSALANKVQELSYYRSEFFGKLREILGNQPGVQIVGDRFVFQSEVLFTTGSDKLGNAGKAQMLQLANTLQNIIKKIPPRIKWILRVDGHTDNVPIKSRRFPSNWELSTARAISVVKFLTLKGIKPNNLAATGFGEFQPIDPRTGKIANRRNRRIELKLTQR
jgi:chemotaxis protein MotB